MNKINELTLLIGVWSPTGSYFWRSSYQSGVCSLLLKASIPSLFAPVVFRMLDINISDFHTPTAKYKQSFWTMPVWGLVLKISDLFWVYLQSASFWIKELPKRAQSGDVFWPSLGLQLAVAWGYPEVAHILRIVCWAASIFVRRG